MQGSSAAIRERGRAVGLAAILVVALGACGLSVPAAAPSDDPSPAPSDDPSPVSTVEPSPTPTEADRPIRTGSDTYELRKDGESLRAGIDYTYTNGTGGTVYLPNCNGAFGLRLDRLTEEGWVLAWSPAQPACLGPPIVIEAGATFDDTLVIAAGVFGSNTHPQFDSEDPSGTYRIVWTEALSSYDDRKHPFGPQIPLEHRISNRFRLTL